MPNDAAPPTSEVQPGPKGPAAQEGVVGTASAFPDDIEDPPRFIQQLLLELVESSGSDLFLVPGFPPAMKIDGTLRKARPKPLTPRLTLALAKAIMNDRQMAEFERSNECNFGIAPSGIGRFRVSAFVQQESVSLVLRIVPRTIPTIESMNLPGVFRELAMSKRGLIILAGATGTGKSTSLAAMLDWRNEHSAGHIQTIEDPIEFVHAHKNCVVTQREVGRDTEGWAVALRNSVRQAPDVVMIGEIRDRETMEHAVAFAETGHLVLTTLHANNTNQALDRAIHLIPKDRRAQLLMDLSLNLRAIISQRLLARQDGDGRVAAVEVMINSPLVAKHVFNGEIPEIREVMKRSRELGMQTFDQALFDLYEAGSISFEDALRNADSLNDLRLRIKLESKRVDSGQAGHTHSLRLV